MFIRTTVLVASLAIGARGQDINITPEIAKKLNEPFSSQPKGVADDNPSREFLLALLEDSEEFFERRFHLLEEARQLSQRGHTLDALYTVSRLITLEPDNAEAFNLRSRISAKLRRFEEGIADSRKALELAKTPRQKAMSACSTGINLVGLERNQEALKAFAEALSFDPSHFSAHFERAKIFIQLKMMSDSNVEIQKALELTSRP